jgi:hypothetical protein
MVGAEDARQGLGGKKLARPHMQPMWGRVDQFPYGSRRPAPREGLTDELDHIYFRGFRNYPLLTLSIIPAGAKAYLRAITGANQSVTIRTAPKRGHRGERS